MARNSLDHKWRSFEKAIKWVHSKNIKNKTDWKKLCKSKKFPDDIPKTPMHIFSKQLKGKGMGYWYGTGKKSTHEIIWRPFIKARKYVRDLEFQNTNKYRAWAKSDQKPQDIPAAPKRVYREFTDWEDWLGNKDRKQKSYLNYFETKKWVQFEKISSGTIWKKLASQNKIPKNIPKAPDKYYKEWEGWPKFLGTIIQYMTYEQASKFVQSKKILGDSSYREYKKKNTLPVNFPRVPDSFYKKQGTWISWGDFCGTGRISTQIQSEDTLPWKIAKPMYLKIKIENNLKNLQDWEKYTKTHDLPKGLPKNPDRSYSKEQVIQKGNKRKLRYNQNKKS